MLITSGIVERESLLSPLESSVYLVKVTTQRECERDGFELAAKGCVQDYWNR